MGDSRTHAIDWDSKKELLLRLVAEGHDKRHIARKLEVSYSAIYSYCQRNNIDVTPQVKKRERVAACDKPFKERARIDPFQIGK